METRLLQYFLAVAQEQNFSRAAETLRTSQPNLSKQISDLESQLGKQLFIRGSRYVTLTEEGQLLQQRAHQILTLIQQTETDVQTLRQPVTGTIHLGISTSAHLRNLSNHLATIRSTNPGVSFNLQTQDTTACHQLMDRGVLDFVLTSEPNEAIDSSRYNILPLSYTAPVGLLMPEDSPLADRTAITPQDLTGHPFVLTSSQTSDTTLKTWIGQDLSALPCAATSDSLTTATVLVTSGLGIAFTPEPTGPETEQNMIWRPLNPPIHHQLSLIWSKHHPLSKAAELLLSHLQQYAQQNPMP